MQIKNGVYFGANNKKALFDIEIPENFNGIVIYFLHGYKGYKDWGAWNLVAQYFINNNFGFAKCNLPYNGTTLTEPTKFDDLQAFAENTYSLEIESYLKFVNFAEELVHLNYPNKTKRIFIGHSRGGADVILAASKTKPDALITWASISDIESRFLKEDKLKEWKNKGVYTVLNGRTNQEMPHNYSFYQDYLDNKEELDIKNKAKDITCEWFIVHGNKDTSVLVNEAEKLKEFQPNAELCILKEADHVFGAKEPFTENFLPEKTQDLVKNTLNWINKVFNI